MKEAAEEEEVLIEVVSADGAAGGSFTFAGALFLTLYLPHSAALEPQNASEFVRVVFVAVVALVVAVDAKENEEGSLHTLSTAPFGVYNICV